MVYAHLATFLDERTLTSSEIEEVHLHSGQHLALDNELNRIVHRC